jgi:hypothetical protein
MRPTLLDEGVFDELAKGSGDGLVSILIPSHDKGPEVAQDRIRLKNAITDVDELMSTAGWRRTDREARLTKARGLLADDEFWQHQGRGLAVFIDESGSVHTIALGEPVDTLVAVCDRFHLRHLIPELAQEPLDALVLTKGSVALFSVDAHGARQVDADLPASMEDVNWFMDYEMQLQRHADRRGSAGVQHGHDPTDRTHEDLSRFLRAVADSVPQDRPAGPLVVLGDDSVIADFRRVARREVIGLTLDGSDRADTPPALHRAVSRVIEERFAAHLSANANSGEQALGTADTVTLFPDVLTAAATGRLARLYLRQGADPLWGRFDPTTLEAAAGADPAVGTVDLLDRVAVLARETGAEVRVTDAPIDGHDVVGVKRF